MSQSEPKEVYRRIHSCQVNNCHTRNQLLPPHYPVLLSAAYRQAVTRFHRLSWRRAFADVTLYHVGKGESTLERTSVIVSVHHGGGYRRVVSIIHERITAAVTTPANRRFKIHLVPGFQQYL